MNLHLTIGPIVSLDRWHFDPCDAATAELYRRDLSNHYRSLGTVRQRQLPSEIVLAPALNRPLQVISDSRPNSTLQGTPQSPTHLECVASLRGS